MILRLPNVTRPDPLFPSTTLFRTRTARPGGRAGCQAVRCDRPAGSGPWAWAHRNAVAGVRAVPAHPPARRWAGMRRGVGRRGPDLRVVVDVVAGGFLHLALRAQEHRNPLVQLFRRHVEDPRAAVGRRAAGLLDQHRRSEEPTSELPSLRRT